MMRLGRFYPKISYPIILLISSFTTYDILINPRSSKVLRWCCYPLKSFFAQVIDIINWPFLQKICTFTFEFLFYREYIWFRVNILTKSY